MQKYVLSTERDTPSDNYVLKPKEILYKFIFPLYHWLVLYIILFLSLSC